MKDIYDNGALMIGELEKIISYIEKDETLETWEYDELLHDLYELRGIAYIVMVNYDNPMKYDVCYWTKNNKLEVI